MSTVIYTAIVGGFDLLHKQKWTQDVDYIMFTDRPHDVKNAGKWQIIELPSVPHLDSRRLSKVPKTNPHAFPELRAYDYTIWVDGSIAIKNPSFPHEFMAHLNQSGLLLSPHFDDRHCSYGEGELCAGLRRFQGEPFNDQMAYYRQEGFPTDMGLYETGVIGRNMQDKNVEKFGSIWLNQNLWWSFRDQVSISYALWKTEYKPDVLPKSFRKYNWLTVNAHTPRRQK